MHYNNFMDREKSETIQVRLMPEEKRAFEEAAAIAGISLSAWIRERLRKASRQDLEEAGKKVAFLQTKGRK